MAVIQGQARVVLLSLAGPGLIPAADAVGALPAPWLGERSSSADEFLQMAKLSLLLIVS